MGDKELLAKFILRPEFKEKASRMHLMIVADLTEPSKKKRTSSAN